MTMRILPSGDRAILVEFGNDIDRATSRRVLALDARLAAVAPEGVVETVPTFRSLMICFDPEIVARAALVDIVARLAEGEEAAGAAPRKLRLPVCYDAEFALDLDALARAAEMTTADVVALHAATPQHVYMLGFLPGQPYLGDLDARLAAPRHKTPRPRIAAGSVGVAGRMTCVFPRETPCGLNIIGRAPIALWRPDREPRALLRPGDEVTFEPVSRRDFDGLFAAAERGDPSVDALEEMAA